MCHCACCKIDHSKFMKRLINKPLAEKIRPGVNIIIKINIEENLFSISDEEEQIQIIQSDIELVNGEWRFFIGFNGNQQTSLKLIECKKIK